MLILTLVLCFGFGAVGLPIPEHPYVHCSDILLHKTKDHSELLNLDKDNCTHIGGEIILDCKDLPSDNYTRMFYRLSYVTKFVGRLHVRNCLDLEGMEDLLPSLKEMQLQYNDNDELESLVLDNTSLRSLPHNPEDIFYGRVILKNNLNLTLPVEQFRRYCCLEKWNSECEKHLETGKEKSEICVPIAAASAQSLVSPKPVDDEVEMADSAPAWLWNKIEGQENKTAWLENPGAENATNTTGFLWTEGDTNRSSFAWLWSHKATDPDSSSIYNPLFIMIVNILFVNLVN